MLFSSIVFLYYFLPIILLLYFVASKRLKNTILFVASFLFYFWGEPKFCLLMILSVVLGYFGGILIDWAKDGEAQMKVEHLSDRYKRKDLHTWFSGKVCMSLLLTVLLTFLIVFKYADFLIESVNAAFGMRIPLLRLSLPLGISFYIFQVISYLVDVYRGDVSAQRSFLRFAAYVTMFPQLIAGPIVRYADIEQELQIRSTTWEDASDGISRFACGLAKKVLVADMLSELVANLMEVQEKGTIALWVLAAAFTLQIYYDFSGYSDMAIGLGKIFGFSFPENFDYPLTAKSVTEFWRRWHMTLGGWFRDYVYIPLGGSRVSFLKWGINVLVVWLLSGLWHGAGWNFALWGLYFAAFLIFEKILRGITQKISGRKRAPNIWKQAFFRLFRHIYTIMVIVVSFVIFGQENIRELGESLMGMFLWSADVKDNLVLWYEIKSYAFLLAAAVFGATPCIHRGIEAVEAWVSFQKYKRVIQPMVTIILFVAVTAFLIGSASHPFLYFRF